jgi:flagellar hook-associated protein 2
MATISSAGIGSGLDINGIITKLMAVEQRPLTALDTKEAAFQAQLSAYGSLKGAVSSLESAAATLTSSSLFGSMGATSSDSTVISASANSAAKSGTYAMEVVGLAKADSIASQQNFISHTSAISTIDGQIKIELGTLTGGVFAADSATPAKTISITAANSSLDSIRDAINSANAGVRANVVYVGSAGYKLTMTSTDTGASKSIKLTTMDSSGNVIANNTDLAKLSYDPAKAAGAGNEYTVTSVAQDAHIKVDGLDLYRASNTITDAVTGLTIKATKIGIATLTVAQDSASITAALGKFVTNYNDLNKQLRSLTAYDASTKTASTLTGDSGARSLQTALRSMINYTFGTSTTLKNLSDVGVRIQKDGSLAFDPSKLSTALQNSPSEVASMFTATTGTKGIAVRIDATLSSLLDSTTGLLATKTNGISRTIKDIGKQRDELNLRLTQIEKNYRTQFTALDTLVASMQQTSAYLTQQLASLTSLSK